MVGFPIDTRGSAQQQIDGLLDAQCKDWPQGHGLGPEQARQILGQQTDVPGDVLPLQPALSHELVYPFGAAVVDFPIDVRIAGMIIPVCSPLVLFHSPLPRSPSCVKVVVPTLLGRGRGDDLLLRILVLAFQDP